MNFLNKNNLQVRNSLKIALYAIAWPGELIFILVWVIFAQNAAVGLFFLTIILFGYPLEIHFIRMGELLLIKEKTIVTELKKMECNNHSITR